MLDQLGAFARAVDSAMCNWFGEHGATITGVGIGLTLVPDPLSTTVGVGLLMANAAAQLGCTYDQDALVDSRCMRDVGVLFAYQVAVQGYDLIIYDDQGNQRGVATSGAPHLEIKRVVRLAGDTVFYETIDKDGNVEGRSFEMGGPVFLGYGISQSNPDVVAWREVGEPCPDVPPELAPVQYIDQTTNCSMTVEFDRFVEGEAGALYVSTKISPSASTRTDGGTIGGCNFNTSLVVVQIGGGGGSGGGGGPWVAPYPTNASTPLLNNLVGGLIRGLVGAGIQQILDAIAGLLGPKFLAGSFTMTAPCDVDGEGKPEFRTWDFDAASFPERMNAHQVALMEMLQQHLNWKTPTCNDVIEKGEGNWRTIGFRSDNTSLYGKSRLRKRFRYRSTSQWTTNELVDHWKDFTFTSGPVIVSHLGASWGSPQVWAATADEGKRVIRHAAGEAGIDPDQVGRWQVGGSSSSRLGVSDTMRVDTTGGFYWITARDGSDNRPDVPTLPDSESGVDINLENDYQ